MATNTNYSLTSSSFTQQTNEKRKKDELQQEKELASLIVMLNDVIEVIATSSSGSPSSFALHDLENEDLSSDTGADTKQTSEDQTTTKTTNSLATTAAPTTPTGQAYPTNDEVASALAAMSEMVNYLELEIQQSSDQAYIMACEIMIAQINAAIAVSQAYLTAWDACQAEINSYYNWAFSSYPNPLVISSDVQKQIDEYMSRTKTINPGSTKGKPAKEPDPDYKGLENYIISHCPCPVYLDPNCTDPTQMLLDAGAQVEADAYSKLEPAEIALEDELLLSTNPALQQIGKMIFNNAEFSESAIEQLEQILNATIEAVTLISGMSSSNYNSGPSNALMIQVLTIMENAVSQMEVLIAKFEQKLTQNDSRCSKIFSEQAKVSLDKAKAETDKIKKLIESAEKAEKASKAMGIASEVIMGLVACLTCNVALILATVVMITLNETGTMSKIEGAIASSIQKDLEKSGVSSGRAEKESKAIASAVVIAIVVSATLLGGYGVSMFAAEAGTEAAAETSETLVAESAEIESTLAAQEASSSSTTSTMMNTVKESINEALKSVSNKFNKLLDLLATLGKSAEATSQASSKISTEVEMTNFAEASNETTIELSEEVATVQKSITETIKDYIRTIYNKMPVISNTAKLAIANGLQEIGSTNLAGYATEADLYGKKSEEEIQKEVFKNTIIVDVAAMIANVGVMNSMSEIKSSELFTSKYLVKLRETLGDTKFIVNSLNTIGLGATMVQTAAQVDLGVTLKKQADAEMILGMSQAMVTYFLHLVEVTNEHSQTSLQEYQDTLKSRQETDSFMLKNMLSFEAEYAKVLSQSA